MNSAWTVVISIFSSSLVTTLITFGIWNIQKKKEFLWDYKKYILKKRQEAYDEVQKVIHLCLLKKTYHGKYQVNTFFNTLEHLKDFIQYTEIVQSGWVSKEVIDSLGKLKAIATGAVDHLLEDDVYYGHDDYGNEKILTTSDILEEYGQGKLKQIEKLNEQLQRIYIKDLKQLGDIDKFTNETL